MSLVASTVLRADSIARIPVSVAGQLISYTRIADDIGRGSVDSRWIRGHDATRPIPW